MVMGYLGFAEEVFFCLMLKGKSSIENVYFELEITNIENRILIGKLDC